MFYSSLVSHLHIGRKLTSLEHHRKTEMNGNEKKEIDLYESDMLNENDEEEDQIFLHPGDVHSPLNNLNKRTSLDYNHNSFEMKNFKSRSMSLPVTYNDLDLDNIFSSDQDSSNSGYNNVASSNSSSLLSPMRKTDFAFCKFLKHNFIHDNSVQHLKILFRHDYMNQNFDYYFNRQNTQYHLNR